MPGEIVQVEWVRERVFLMRDRNDYPIVMTQPMGANGADLLPLSLIGCASWDVIAILEKQRQAVTGLRATAESVRDPEPPWRFRSIHVHYILTGRDLDPLRVRRAIELAETRYCAVYATLREAVRLTSDFEIIASPSATTGDAAAR